MKTVLILLTLTLPVTRAADGPAAPSTAPAHAAILNPVREADLTTVTLTPEAATRLGIATVPVARKVLAQTRLYGGEISLPLEMGAEAPSLMNLAPPQNAAEILKLAEQQATADGEIAQAKIRQDAAQRTQERAEKLLTNETGSARAAEDARSALDLAKAALAQTTARRALLGPGFAAAPDGSRWWVRVAIPGADAATLDPQAAASLSLTGTQTLLTARHMTAAPPTANALASTVDWYFETADPQRQLRPGQRVQIRLAVSGAGAERLTAPWAGVLYDIHGGQWVYEMTTATTFVRRRVQVAQVSGADAVLGTGPPAGAKIVTDGAAELFGIEFGPGK
jgi:hypothetical protein